MRRVTEHGRSSQLSFEMSARTSRSGRKTSGKLPLPPPHPSSAWQIYGLISSQWSVAVLALFWEAVWIAITTLLIIHDYYNWHMYTYWQWAFFHVFFASIFLGEVLCGLIQSITALVLRPFADTTAKLVAIVIAIIIATNAKVYIDGTTCEDTENGIDIGLVRLVDWLLHGLPILALFTLANAGHNDEVKFQVTMMARAAHWGWTAAFILFVLCSTPLTMLVYVLVEDPMERYHPNIPLWALILIGISINLVLAVAALINLFSNPSRKVGMIPWYSKLELMAWEAKVHEMTGSSTRMAV